MAVFELDKLDNEIIGSKPQAKTAYSLEELDNAIIGGNSKEEPLLSANLEQSTLAGQVDTDALAEANSQLQSSPTPDDYITKIAKSAGKKFVQQGAGVVGGQLQAANVASGGKLKNAVKAVNSLVQGEESPYNWKDILAPWTSDFAFYTDPEHGVVSELGGLAGSMSTLATEGALVSKAANTAFNHGLVPQSLMTAGTLFSTALSRIVPKWIYTGLNTEGLNAFGEVLVNSIKAKPLEILSNAGNAAEEYLQSHPDDYDGAGIVMKKEIVAEAPLALLTSGLSLAGVKASSSVATKIYNATKAGRTKAEVMELAKGLGGAGEEAVSNWYEEYYQERANDYGLGQLEYADVWNPLIGREKDYNAGAIGALAGIGAAGSAVSNAVSRHQLNSENVNVVTDKEQQGGVYNEADNQNQNPEPQQVEISQDKQTLQGSGDSQKAQVKDLLANTPTDRVKYYAIDEEGESVPINKEFFDEKFAKAKDLKAAESDIVGQSKYEFTSRGNKYYFTIDNGKPAEAEQKEQPKEPTEDVKAALAKERQELLDGGFVIRTDNGTAIPYRYEVVPVEQLVTSHDHNTFLPNERFPKEKQPRDRGGATMQKDVITRAQNLDPSRLMSSDMVNTGAPVVTLRDDASGYDVINGNGRTMSIMRALDENGQKAKEYREAVIDFLSKGDENAKKQWQAKFEQNPNSVLVRQAYPGDDNEVSAIVNSTAGGMTMSAAETAQNDAKLIDDNVWSFYKPNEDGDITSAGNKDFVQRVLGKVIKNNPALEQQLYPNGELSLDGIKRVQNAVFAYAYQDSGIISKFANTGNTERQKIINGLLKAAPAVAKARSAIVGAGRQDLDFVPYLLDACKKMNSITSDAELADYVNSDSLFEGGDIGNTAKDILRVLYEKRRSAKDIGNFINDMATTVQNTIDDEASDALFESVGNVDVGGIIHSAAANNGVMLPNRKEERNGQKPVVQQDQNDGRTSGETDKVDEGAKGKEGEGREGAGRAGETPTTRTTTTGTELGRTGGAVEREGVEQSFDNKKTSPNGTATVYDATAPTIEGTTRSRSNKEGNVNDKLSNTNSVPHSTDNVNTIEQLNEVVNNGELSPKSELENLEAGLTETKPNADYKLAEGYRTESGKPLLQANEREYILLPDGSKDFGQISESVSNATNGKIKSIPVRLQVGTEEYGAIHIFRPERIKQIQSKGFTVYDYIKYVINNFTEIYDQSTSKKPNRFVFYVEDKTKGLMPVDLEVRKNDGEFYTIVSIIPHRSNNIKGVKIFDGSARPSTDVANGAISSVADNKGDTATTNGSDKISTPLQSSLIDNTLPQQKTDVKKKESNTTKEAAQKGGSFNALTGGEKQKSQTTPKTDIQDFGEKIGGAKKDLAAEWKKSILNALELDEKDLYDLPLSKVFPKPNVEKLMKQGVDFRTINYILALRTALGRKPTQEHQLRRWIGNLKKAINEAKRVLNKDYKMDGLDDLMLRNYEQKLANYQLTDGAKVVFLEQTLLNKLYDEKNYVGSYGDFIIDDANYAVYKGEHFKEPKRIVSIRSKDGNLEAVGATPKEAIENFVSIFNADALSVNSADKKSVNLTIYEWKDKNKKYYFIGRKYGSEYIEVKKFPYKDSSEKPQVRKEAGRYLSEHKEELSEQYRKMTEGISERNLTNRDRVGSDYRQGTDVTPEMFTDTFDFRGVEFGNYVEGKRRQADLNKAYDALMDLANILGISPRALSLNGELGLAFGARGSGNHAAHYEPDKVVINLTKTHGAGSLAHEWWHAIDSYFMRSTGKKSEYALNYVDVIARERKIFNDLITGKRGEAFIDGNYVRADRKNDAFLISKPNEKPQKLSGAEFEKFADTKVREFIRKHFADTTIRPEMLDAFANVLSSIYSSGMVERSKRHGNSKYWASNIEMGARAFEASINYLLEQKGYSNDYLANIKPVDIYEGEEKKTGRETSSYPYPTREETKDIAQAYVDFFNTIEEAESGSHIMLREDAKNYNVKFSTLTKSSRDIDRTSPEFHKQFIEAMNAALSPHEVKTILNYFDKNRGSSQETPEYLAAVEGYRFWRVRREGHQGALFGKLWQKVYDYAKANGNTLEIEAEKLYNKAVKESVPIATDKKKLQASIQTTLDFETYEEEYQGVSKSVLQNAVGLWGNTNPLQSKVNVKGLSITRELVEEKQITLVGRTVKSAKELAILAQAMRSPGYEKFHRIFVDADGKVLKHDTISCGLPDCCQVQTVEEKKSKSYDVPYGTKKIYFVHNHPSGNPQPSIEDRQSTKQLGKTFYDLDVEHIVLDTDKYAVIQTDETWEYGDVPASAQVKYDVPSIRHEALMKIPNAATAAELVKYVEGGKDTVFFVDATNQVRSVIELPDNAFRSGSSYLQAGQIAEYLRNVAMSYYGNRAIIVTSNSDTYSHLVDAMEQEGGILDVILTHSAVADGGGSTFIRSAVDYGATANSKKWYGRDKGDYALKVQEEGVDNNKNEALASVVSSPARTGWRGAFDKGGVTGVIHHLYDELYTDWVDKFHPLDNFDKATNAPKGERLLDRVHMVGALTSGYTNTLIDGNEKSIKVVEEQINAKLHKVTLKDVLTVINPKEMDKLYPGYLEQFGKGKDWHDMFGVYLTWRRLAEMSQLHDQAYIQEYKEWQKRVEAEKYWADNDGTEATRPEPAGAEPKYKPYKLPNGLTEEDLQNAIEQAPEEFERGANLFYLWNDNILTILERGNIISPETHKLLNTKYKNYCSLMRDFSQEGVFDDYLSGINNGGRGIANVKTTLKRISEEGSERLVLNPLEVAVKACAVAVNRAERNKVAMFAVDKLEQNGYGLVVPVKGEPHPDPGRCIFTVMFEGKPKAYKCVPELYEPITLMDRNSSGIVMEAMAAAARALRTGATISPSFTIRNFARDTMQAGIASSNGFKPIVDSIRGAWKLVNDEQLAAEFEALGVSSFNFYTHRNAIKKTLKELAPKRNNVTWSDAMDVFKRAFGMEDFSAFVEASTRAGEYYLARKHGKSMLEAALDARRVTIDFARSGRLGQEVNKYIPFFNATIQGTDINARLVGGGLKAAYNFAKGDRSAENTQKLRIFAKILSYAIIPAILLRALVDDEPWYDELDPRVKYSNWVFPNGTIFPMSQEWGLYASLALATLDNYKKNDKKAFEHWRELVRETVTPNVLPTMILPVVEGIANYSFWTGKPLANQRLMKLPPEQRAYASTSELSKWFGKQTGIPPVVIDNTIRGYTGTMGTFAWGIAGDAIYAMAGEEKNAPAKAWNEKTFIRDFSVNSNKLRRYTDEFMDIVKEAGLRKDDYRPYMKGINALNRKITDLYKMNRGIDEGKIYPKHSPEFKKQLKDRNNAEIRRLSKLGVERFGDKINH